MLVCTVFMYVNQVYCICVYLVQSAAIMYSMNLVHHDVLNVCTMHQLLSLFQLSLHIRKYKWKD